MDPFFDSYPLGPLWIIGSYMHISPLTRKFDMQWCGVDRDHIRSHRRPQALLVGQPPYTRLSDKQSGCLSKLVFLGWAVGDCIGLVWSGLEVSPSLRENVKLGSRLTPFGETTTFSSEGDMAQSYWGIRDWGTLEAVGAKRPQWSILAIRVI